MRWRSFVAVGDSFTEGLDDPHPAGNGYRGWADLVAARLARERDGDFGYANLAVRGRLFNRIVSEQVSAALAMGPDLISFAGGGNDVLRRGFEPDAAITRFDNLVRELRASGADLVVFRFADLTVRLPGRRVILPRVQIMNQAVGEVADKYGAMLVDLWSDDEFANPLLWSVDRLHLSTAGHQRVAAHVLAAMGLAADPEWWAPPPPPTPRSWAAARRADIHWAGQHFAPWLRRRLTGRSSGDGIDAKRPVLGPFTE
ncbi:MAG TPA: SGNH/GDSL hydrolase family protein [Micromonosporaceae bacterium]|nr:SGNH/GDSL hydrolase family protein [Micromonosporaceae bacterium]